MMKTDLILLDLQGLDVIFSMDWLAVKYASVDCFQKKVIFRQLGFTNSGIL